MRLSQPKIGLTSGTASHPCIRGPYKQDALTVFAFSRQPFLAPGLPQLCAGRSQVTVRLSEWRMRNRKRERRKP